MGRAPATLPSLSPKESALTPWLGVGTGSGSNKDSRWSLPKARAQRHSGGYPPPTLWVSLWLNLRKQSREGAGLVALRVATCSLPEASETMWDLPRAGLGLLLHLV